MRAYEVEREGRSGNGREMRREIGRNQPIFHVRDIVFVIILHICIHVILNMLHINAIITTEERCLREVETFQW